MHLQGFGSKTVYLKKSEHLQGFWPKTMYLKCFGIQSKTVYLQGPYTSRLCISRPCCILTNEYLIIWNSTPVHWLLFVRRLSWGRTYVFFHSKRFQHFGLRLIETQKDWEFPSRRHSYLVHPKWSHFNFSWASKDCAMAHTYVMRPHKKRIASIASL